jgi:biotin carboxyl carrier protein
MQLTINQKTHEVSFPDNTSAQVNDVEVLYSILELGAENFHLLSGNNSYRIRILERNNIKGELTLSVNEVEVQVKIKDNVEASLEKMGINLGASTQIKELKAPMPGLVLRVEVASGDIVQKGEPLLVLEAMKMENVIKSPTDGTIDSVQVHTGDKVEKNQILIIFS